MSGYGAQEARIAPTGRPEAVGCKQCEDTGFITTAFGDVRVCPQCEEDEGESVIERERRTR